MRAATLLDSVSPYGNRRVTVEFDGAVTTAYLRDATTVIATARLAEGAPSDPATLRAVWFEEGDGAALLERDALLAVLPDWPGRDLPRVERAMEFWRWRESPGGWGRFQSAVLSHLSARLGPGAHYWDGSRGQRPAIGISERPPGPGRGCTVLSTVGMSAQRMPAVERVLDDPRDYARVELALATTIPPGVAALTFLWLAAYPWRAVTWFGPGHSVRWHDSPGTFPLGAGYQGVLLLDDVSGLRGPAAPDLSGFAVEDDPVRWLWIVPITERSRLTARDQGSGHLVRELAAEGRSWIAGPPGPLSP